MTILILMQPFSERTRVATVAEEVALSFSNIARSMNPVTDKIDHGYGPIYDFYFTEAVMVKAIKFLEIGLGCNMYVSVSIIPWRCNY